LHICDEGRVQPEGTAKSGGAARSMAPVVAVSGDKEEKEKQRTASSFYLVCIRETRVRQSWQISTRGMMFDLPPVQLSLRQVQSLRFVTFSGKWVLALDGRVAKLIVGQK